MAVLDLHIHSSHSLDGEISPGTIVDMAVENGIHTLAIADHNRISAIPAAASACARAGIRLVPAVELDCRLGQVDLHVLGYHIDPADARYAELDKDVTAKEQAASQARVEKIRRLGLVIDQTLLDRLAPDSIATGELLAEIALADERNADCRLLDPYRPGGERSDNPQVNFYWDYCARGKQAFSEVVFMPLDQAVQLITDTGGVAVLAHPGVNLHQREHLLQDIANHGVKGVEAYCSYHSPEQAAFWHKQAAMLGMFATCGSDFHGKTKPAVRLGRHGGDAHEQAIAKALVEWER